jgi:outer membrane protein
MFMAVPFSWMKALKGMATKAIGSLLLLSIGMHCSVFAQDTSFLTYAVPWDLQTCLDYAMKNNIQLNSLRLTKKSGEQNLLLSRASRLPNLTGSATQNVIGSKNTNLTYGVSPSGSYSLNSSMTIFNGGFINSDIKQKGLLVQQADLSVSQQLNDLTLLITEAYLNILLSKENIIYIKDLVNTSVAQVGQAQQQYDVGTIALVSLAELQSQLANDKYLLVTATNSQRQNTLTLKQLLQLPTDTPFQILVPDTLMATGLLTPLQEVQRIALATRPEVKNSELGVSVSELDLAKARAGYLPVLTAGGILSSSYVKDPNNNYFKQLDNNFYQQIGLTLSVPIFTRRVNKTNVELSKIEIDQSKLTLQDTKTNLSQTVEQAYISVLNAQAQYDAAVEQFRYTQESYRIASEQLKVGVANIVEYLQQKNLYIQALQAYIQAKYTAALNIRIYDFYRGIPVKI